MSESLWHQLKKQQKVKGDMPAREQDEVENIWYIRLIQGIAGWLAALFLMGFLGFGVAGLFEHGAAMMVLGLVINVSAYGYYKADRDSDFFEQMVLAFSLTGQFLFAFGMFELFDFKNRHWLVVVGIYQLLLMWVMNHYLHRFLSAWFAIIALFWGFESLVYSGVGSALVGAVFVWLWLDKCGWQAERNFYEPIAYALGLSLLQLNVQSHAWLFGGFYRNRAAGSWLMQNADWLSALLNSVVLLYLVYRLALEYHVKLSSQSGRLLVLAALVLLFSAMPVIGLSSALLVLLVGYARQNVVLMVMGGLALLGFVSWYYYSLHITLLNKSLILMVMGLVLLFGYVLLWRLWHGKAVKSDDTKVESTLSSWQKWAAALTLLVALVGVNHAIWEKETVLDEGQSVFLELAPVDPRSIMQGDFMRLRFAMANSIRDAHRTSLLDLDHHQGLAIVNVNEQGVGSFHDLYSGQQLAPKQVLMQYRQRHGRIQFATNAFFFQEGDAQLFDNAKFGEFKVAEDGELLLKAMYDHNLKLLGNNRLD